MPTIKFWLVNVDNGTTSKRHTSLDDAKKEAARLAAKEHNRAYVMESIMAALPVDNIRWENAGGGAPVPVPIPPPIPQPAPAPPSPPPDGPIVRSLPAGYSTDPAVALDMLRIAMHEHNLTALGVQGHGQVIVDALNGEWPGLDAYVNPATDAVVWPGFGSIDCTIDSGKGGFYFRPDPPTDKNRVPWLPKGQR